jgi:PAS domain S-box-containing protein
MQTALQVPASRATARPGNVAEAKMTLTTRLAIAMIALVAIAVTAVGWLSHSSLEQALLPRVLDRIEAHSQLVAADLQSYTRGAGADVAGFRASAAANGLVLAHLNGGIDPVDRLTEATWRERLSTRLVAELQAKPAYSKFRLIGAEGGQPEIVRVDRSGPNGAIRVVRDAELQQKADRPFVDATLKLRPDEVYVSPVNLNQDNGVIESPHVPTLRVATPIAGPDGKPFGILIINVDMRPALDRVRTAVRPGGAIYAVNSRGDYLVHPDRSRELGSDLGKPSNWQADFPELASSLGATQTVARIVPDQTGRPSGTALAPAILAGSEWVGVIETVPNAVILAPLAAIRSTSLLVGLIAVLCAAALAVLVARSLARPIVRLTTAVERTGRNDPVCFPVGASGEIGVLAQAFARVMGEANSKTEALEREVQEHRRTEVARDHHAARERLFSAAVESSNDAIITKSLDGTITGWNPAAERLFGFTAAEVVGKSIDLIVPADRMSEAHDMLDRICRGERIQHHETIRLRSDGSPVEVSLGISPIKTPSGTIIGASKTATDITERKRTEKALSQEIEERRRIFESSQDLILVTDSEGTLMQVSPSAPAILGYLPAEMIGRNAIEFIHGEDLENARAEMRGSRRGRHSRNYDSRYLHKDGRIVTLSWMGTWSDPVKRHFFVGRDMTESRQAREKLLESEQQARGIIDTALDAFVQMPKTAVF